MVWEPVVKHLSEMTLEELWQLFPIVLVPHQDCWDAWYDGEAGKVEDLLAGEDVRVQHIGSTAIRGIWAKPTIDILVEIPEGRSLDSAKEKLLPDGWGCMYEGRERIALQKGYTEQGFAEKVFHLHLHHRGDNDELYLRDYLNDHPELAAEYEKLKLSLWKRYEHDRDGYTQAKGDFIRECTAKAKAEYGDRWA